MIFSIRFPHSFALQNDAKNNNNNNINVQYVLWFVLKQQRFSYLYIEYHKLQAKISYDSLADGCPMFVYYLLYYLFIEAFGNCSQSSLTKSAPRSPIIMTGAFGLPLIIVGIILASTTRSPLTP